ncbi:MAG: 3-deoxy-D-manno-octulosonic acid transferase [Muribaculaceae bacterium]|nr:3-deoxy-D-manno-octulosonic acid transferase [Muribaculaceae bacterium]
MNPLYNLGIRAFSLGARVAAAKGGKAAKLVAGQKGIFDTLGRAIDPSGRYIWIHAASLGEFEQGRPLIEKIRRERPDAKILLTFFSPSGYEVRKNYEGADIVVYLPFDTPGNVSRWLNTVPLEAAIFVKYEFWGNYLTQLRKRGVPTYLISAIFRRGQIFFRPWGGMFRRMLRCYTWIFVQDEGSRELLADIGVRNVTVAGDTRFDRVTEIMTRAREIPVIEDFVSHAEMTLVVGSSWEPDEDVYIPWLNAHSGVKAIVAPHEYDAVRLERLRERLGKGTMLLSELNEHPQRACDARHVIIDCFGLLSSLYRYGDVAYVGGGFGAGIHNINEAAVYGIPVIFGPNHSKFREAAGLVQCGGGVAITDAKTGADALDSCLADESYRRKSGEAAARYIKENIGATDTIYDAIFAPRKAERR